VFRSYMRRASYVQELRRAHNQVPMLRRKRRFQDCIIGGIGSAWFVGLVMSFIYMDSLDVQDSIQFFDALMTWVIYPSAFVVGFGTCAFVLLNLASWKRTTAAVRAADFRLCIFCGYPLTGIDEAGSCPECGKPFDIEETQRLWRAVIDAPKPTNGSL